MSDQCAHPETELRYRRTNRAIQRQCLTCGTATTPAIPHSQFTVAQLATLPDWDAKLADSYWAQRRLDTVAEAVKANEELRLKCEREHQNGIVALPSYYRHTKFRSRLEARWARYFDLIGCKWQYEPEGYALPQGNYCPDFYCDHVEGFFVEVKPSPAELSAVKDKLLSLAMLTGREVYGVVGPPTIQPQWAAFPDGRTTDEGNSRVIFCAYGFAKWGRVYYNEEIDSVCRDEDEWQRAAAMRFENGHAQPDTL